VLVLRALILQQLKLRCARINQRPLLSQIETGGESKIMSRPDEPERIAFQPQAVAHHVDLGVEFSQREIVGRELRDQDQTGVFEIRVGLLRGGPCAFDLAANPAEQISLVIHCRSERKVVLHRGLIRFRIGGKRPVRRCLATRGASAKIHRRIQSRRRDGHLVARLIEPRRGNFDVLIGVERAFHQWIQGIIVEQPPPLALQGAVGRRRRVPRRWRLPAGRGVHRRLVVIGSHCTAAGGKHGAPPGCQAA